MRKQDDAPVSPAEAPTIEVIGGGATGARNEPMDSSSVADSFDEILKRVVRPAEQLAAGSELVGRFKITRVLGEGGMGTVYVARDRALGRDVAIKIHRAVGGAARLRREAVAMARLAHPNVVTVFEVGELAERPFVVMEYVPGTTLRAWLAAAPRSVRDILAMMMAAGEGLAAAHDAGLVHRDIKPENVLIGADGRARVGDFGLARELDTGEATAPEPSGEPPEPALAPAMTPVTQTGAVLGTPAYMSPEQFAGEPVDARADQFAFCVAVWEALWSERPFPGTSYAQVNAAISRGTRRPPPASPRVSARVRAALDRGLSVRAADRFPTMHALLAAMRPAGARRGRWIGGCAVVLGLAGLVAVIAARGAAPGGAGALAAASREAAACETAGAAELAQVPSDVPARLGQRGATALAAQADQAIRQYVARFRDHAQQACRAAAAHEWSAEIAARSQACFAIAARTQARWLAAIDPTRPLDAARRLRELPSDDACRNPTYLGSRPEPPGDPARLDELAEASATLALGQASAGEHDHRQLRAALAALEASPVHGDPRIAAGITLLRGWVAFAGGQIAECRARFADAYYAARAIDDDELTSRAISVLVASGGSIGVDSAAIASWMRTAVADAERIRHRSPNIAGEIYLMAAGAEDLGGHADPALGDVARARELIARDTAAWARTYEIEGAVRMWSGHIDEGVQAYEQSIAQLTALYGADDPDLAQLLSNYATSLLDAGRAEPALAAADRANQIIHELADPDDDRIDAVRVNLAAVLSSGGHDATALTLLETARAHDVRRLGETNTVIANIDSNLATIYNGRGESARAIQWLESALAIDEQLLGPDHPELADVLYNLAAARRTHHEPAIAQKLAERAARIYAAKSPGSDRQRLSLIQAAAAANDAHQFAPALAWTATVFGFAKPPEDRQVVAWAQLERARALLGVHHIAEATPLLRAARAVYDELHMTQRVEQIDSLLAGRTQR